MACSEQFQRGDVVIHTRRPEWGEGVVHHASVIAHEGRSAQRLMVRFANRGQVTVNTAVAQLTMKDSNKAMASTNTSTFESSASGQGWLDSLDRKGDQTELWSLPEAMTDPFSSAAARLRATLASYRFSKEPRSLIDWAVAQSGLADPLSSHNRHELEQAFVRFERDRDRHLVDLVRTIKKQNGRAVLDEQLRAEKLPNAQRALRSAIDA